MWLGQNTELLVTSKIYLYYGMCHLRKHANFLFLKLAFFLWNTVEPLCPPISLFLSVLRLNLCTAKFTLWGIVFSVWTNGHSHMIWNVFIITNPFMCLWGQSPTLFPAPGNCWSDFCFHSFAFAGRSYKWNGMQPFVTDYFHLAWCFWDSSIIACISRVSSLLLLDCWWYFTVQMYHHLFILQVMDIWIIPDIDIDGY